MAIAQNISKRLEQLSGRLLNLTRRNKSIRLLRKTLKQCFDLAEAEPLRPGVSERALKAVLAGKAAVILSQRDVPADPREERHKLLIGEDEELEEVETEDYRLVKLFRGLENNLTQLSRNANLIESETGAVDLYLGYPWISGICDDTDATYLQAPLLLFPVRLSVQRTPRLEWEVTAREGAEPIFNEALKLALEQYHNTSLSEEFEEAAEAAAATAENAGALLHWFQERFSAMGLRMAEPGLEPSPLPEFKQAEVPTQSPGFRIANHAVIGYFPQADSSLRHDYEQLVTGGEVSDILAQLLDSAAEASGGNVSSDQLSMDSISEAATCWVMPTDASQETAMLRSRQTPCMAIHGPPGTGKSQVIVNLIADALWRGERVLLCCQKRAAIDVVYQRLDALGLARHVALVHDYANDRKAVYQHIGLALDDAADPRVQEQLAREAATLAASIDDTTNRLRTVAHLLHARQTCGHTAHELYTRAANFARPLDETLMGLAPRITRPELDALLVQLTNLQVLQRQAGKHLSRWSGRRSFAALTFLEEKQMREGLKTVEDAAMALARVQEGFELELPTATALDADRPHLQQLADSPTGADVAALYAEPGDGSATERALLEAIKLAAPLQQLPPRPRAGEVTPTPAECVTLEAFNAGRSKLFRIFSGEWRRARADARAFLAREGLPDDAATVATAAAKGRSLQQWQRLDAAIAGTALPDLLRGIDTGDALKARALTLAEAAKQAGAAKTARSSLAGCLTLVGNGSLEEAAANAAKLLRLHDALIAVRAKLETLEFCLRPEAITRFVDVAAADGARMATLARKLAESLEFFDAIQGFDSQHDQLSEAGREVLNHLRTAHLEDEWPAVTDEAVTLGWLHQVERAHPELRETSAGEGGALRTRFRQQLEQRRALNQKLLALKLCANATTPRFEPGREVDGRHSIDKPWRDLRHQVGKKSRLWPLRRMVHSLRWPLFEIMPCWLVSPETLSAAFPLEQGLFDLVIFDEASQCAVQHGIPAIHRARRVVIAGDEQQLRPFDLFGALGVNDDEEEDDEADSAAVEAESILTLAKARFPQEMLECHYRSKFEELIDFSNHGFYDGRLLTVPPADRGNGPPMEWHKVDGLWENRRNRREAEAVLDVLYEQLKQHGTTRSFGVITFNNTQKDEIQNQLDKRMAEPEFGELFSRALNPESGDRDAALFVKNIENVQGDERDIILFSIGYGPSEPGGRVRSSFGSLNKEGGDNRLNVAVSRAKERIIVVSSIEPGDLNVATAKNRGPVLLRSYLEYAKAVAAGHTDTRDGVLREINQATGLNARQGGTFDSVFEEMVYEELRKRGLELHLQVGVSGYRIDLGVVDPDQPSRYLLGIECDGASYHRARSVRERDAYRQRFLEHRGWAIHRIWSRNWWRDKQREADKVVELVNKLREQAKTPAR